MTTSKMRLTAIAVLDAVMGALLGVLLASVLFAVGCAGAFPAASTERAPRCEAPVARDVRPETARRITPPGRSLGRLRPLERGPSAG
jgi:hypothetical protein